MAKRKNISGKKVMKVRITFTEEVLGTASADPDIHANFIASKAPDAQSLEEEVASIGVDEVIEHHQTVFSRDKDGHPILWDYQFKGFFKEACSMLRRAGGTKSGELTAFKKEIDGLVFVFPRQVKIVSDGPVGSCQRSLRAATAQGERTALANSETIPAGSWCDITILMLNGSDEDYVREWLDYGALKGIGQWRNSGKGKFTWEELPVDEEAMA